MDEQADRQTYMRKLVVAFHNFANASENARDTGGALYIANTGHYDNNYKKKKIIQKREIIFRWSSVKFLPLPRSHSEHIRI
jgi:hypothetical protein